LDFKTAFDSVNYDLLIKKLEYFGIRGNNLNLIKTFISDRPQQVKMNGLISDVKTNCFSVPQGTVLGPVLFIIYINGLLNIKPNADIFCYPDDTVILIKSHNENFYKIPNNCLSAVKYWCDNNNLQLNLFKSKYTAFNIMNSSYDISTDFSLCVHI